MGMPIATLIEIPQAEFEVTPQAFAEAPKRDKNRVFVNEKQEQLLEFQKQSVMAGYYPTLSLTAGYNRSGSKNALGSKAI
jgi:outer membrane protein TolC